MVRLYRGIDGTFIDLWNGIRRQADPSWVHELQLSLHELAFNHSECTEGWTAEVMTTQHWLRAVIWQLCSSLGFMGSFTKESVLFLSPSCIAEDLQPALERLPHFAVQARGGDVVSLFENQPYIQLGCRWHCWLVDCMLPSDRVRRSVD